MPCPANWMPHDISLRIALRATTFLVSLSRVESMMKRCWPAFRSIPHETDRLFLPMERAPAGIVFSVGSCCAVMEADAVMEAVSLDTTYGGHLSSIAGKVERRYRHQRTNLTSQRHPIIVTRSHPSSVLTKARPFSFPGIAPNKTTHTTLTLSRPIRRANDRKDLSNARTPSFTCIATSLGRMRGGMEDVEQLV